MFKTLLISAGVDSPNFIPGSTLYKLTDTRLKVPNPSTYKAKFILIPQNLDIINLLAKNPPNVKQCNDNIYKQADKCAVILNLIIRAYMKAEHSQRISYKGFANVSAQILQHHVQDYNEYIDFLINVGVIETDNHYIVNEKSKGYKLTTKYIDVPLKEYAIPDHNGNTKSGAAVYNKISIVTPDQKSTIRKYQELYKDLLSVTVSDIDQAYEYIYNQLYTVGHSSVLENIKEKRDGKLARYIKLNDQDKLSYMHSNITRKQNVWYESLHSLDQKRVYFVQDTTSNRLHTSLLSVKSECRHFLRLQGGNIISCDINNSQPYISSFFFTPGDIGPDLFKILENCFSIIKQQNKALFQSILERINYYKQGNILPCTQRFINLVQNGEIYEFMAINIGDLHSINRNKTIYYDRNHGKNCVFKLYFNPNKHGALVRDIFRIQFPQVASLFEDINSIFTHTRKESTYHRLSRSNNVLAITLQTIESYLVLDVVCKNMKDKYPHIPLLTVHDAIATNPEFLHPLLEEMKTILSKYIGIQPSIKVEDWSMPALD